jgi:predicted nucleic acid-binding protein
MPSTVDTRFFLTHYFANTDQLRMKTARRMVELQREEGLVPTIVLHEVYKYMHEKVGMDVAQLRINSILTSRLNIVDLTPKIALASAALRCRYKDLPTADSIVAGTSIECKSKRVLSDDPHFKEIREIRTEWI